MSLITHNGIVELIDRGVVKCVDPDLVNAASLDVRLTDRLLVESNQQGRHVDLAAKQVPAMQEMPMQDGAWCLRPGDFVLGATVELFNLPNDVACEYRLKSSLARAGLDAALAMWGDPGWHGSAMTLELKNNLQHHCLLLPPGMKIGQIIFLRGEPVPDHASYAAKGQYNGDRSVQESKGVR